VYQKRNQAANAGNQGNDFAGGVLFAEFDCASEKEQEDGYVEQQKSGDFARQLQNFPFFDVGGFDFMEQE
jgi:hypothetical protein